MPVSLPVNLVEAAGPMLLVAAVMASVAVRFDMRVRIGAAIAGAVLALVPFGSQSFTSLALGVLGPVSAATLVMLATSLRATLAGTRGGPTTVMLLLLVAVGAAFYPLTFGLTVFDPYEYGYRGLAVPALMLVIVAIGWWRRAPDVPCWIALAALLYIAGAYDSRNLWDYLIFPFDPFVALIVLAVRALRALLFRTAAVVSPPNA
jgi:hypothetical protein